jgi:ABC-2 type transport system permease protein
MNPTLLGFIKKELMQALRDKRMRAVIFILPVIQMTLFGLALNTDVKNIRLELISKPGDILMQRVRERCLASGWFVPAKTSGGDPIRWLKSGEAEAVLIAPRDGLPESVVKGTGKIQVLIDASNAIRARQIETYVQSVVGEVVKSEMKGAQGPAPAITTDIRILYNPSMKSSIFLVPGVMGMILCLITVLLASMSMSREREIGTFETLISAPVQDWEILAGKTIPFVILGMADVPIILGVAMFLFGVPLHGSLWLLLLAGFVFVCTTVSIGTLISTFADNQQQSMMGSFLFLFPALLLSGLMFPLENIPPVFTPLVTLNPLKYFIVILRNIMLKGGHSGLYWENMAWMAALAVGAVSLSALRFKQKLN